MVYMCAVIQSTLNLCDYMNYSPPGFSVYRILQARILHAFLQGIFPTQEQNPHWQVQLAYVSYIDRQVLHH